ncbi:MAG: hypothetical protein KDA58_12295, partial [Planctomycetaceae bacterium]|nr:hypothetical protein [Planctomycetaceae bacterium]
TAIETDEAGNPGPEVTETFIKDTVAPTGLAIDDPTEGDDFSNIVETPDVTITGTGAEPTSTVEVTLTDENGTSLGPIAATVNPDGTWVIPDQDISGLGDGTITITAVETDEAGNEGAPVTETFVKDTIAPTGLAIDGAVPMTIESDQVVNAAEAPDVTITGDGVEPTSTVEVTITDQNGTALGPISAAVNPDGTWSIPDQDFSGLVDGPVVISAVETDAAGNPGPAVETTVTLDTTAPPKPPVTDLTDATDSAGASNTDDLTNIQLPNFQGPPATGTPGDTVNLYVTPTDENGAPLGPPQLVGTATVNPDGSYLVSVDPGNPLPEGYYDVTVSMTDPAGNEGEPSDPLPIEVDLTEPTGIQIDTGLEGEDVINAAESTDVTITGTGVEPTSTVEVTITDINGNSVGPISATVNPDGTVTLPDQVVSVLDDGPLTITAIEADAAGNVGDPVESTVELDTTPPDDPTLPPNLTDETDTAGDSNTDDLTYIDTPTFNVPAGTGTPGDTVTLYVDGTPVVTGTVQPDGSFAVDIPPGSPLSEGPHDVTYTFTDPAGNESGPSPTLTVVIDTTPPVDPDVPDLSAPSDSGFLDDDDLTNVTQPTFEGTGEPGDTVTLLIDGQPVGTAVIQPDGTYAVVPTSPLSEGDHAIQVIFTDPAGNSTPPSPELPIVIDTTPPNPDDVTATDAGPDFVSGTGEPGAEVVLLDNNGQPLTDGSGEVLTTIVDGDGEWTISGISPQLPSGTTVTVQQTDPAGNTSFADIDVSYFAFDSFTNQATNPTNSLLDRLFNGMPTQELLSAQIQRLGSEPILSGSARPGTVLVAYLYASDGSVLAREEVHVDSAGNWLVQFHSEITDPTPRLVIEHVATERVPLGTTDFTLSGTSYTQLSFGSLSTAEGTAPGDVGGTAGNGLSRDHDQNLNPLNFLRN